MFGVLAAGALLGCSSGGEPLPGVAGAKGGGVRSNAEAVLGTGSPEAVRFVTLYDPKQEGEPTREATDLDFNPKRPGELWAVMRPFYDGTPCNEPPPGKLASPACAELEGTVAVISGADTASPRVEVKQDANAWHFMRRPTGIAFGPNDTFATCGEHRTGNWDDAPADFMGPTLWSSDPAIFGPDGPGGNGSHLDMLHATPFSMGIAHERDNVYWVFNGQVGAVDRYDFHEPHVPGGADHSDGEASRWLLGQLAREPGVPSHLAYDSSDGALYIADTGNGRVVRLDTTTGREGKQLPTDDGQMPFVTEIEDAAVAQIVSAGVLELPSGLAVNEGVLYVTDHSTSLIHAFDLEGNALLTLDTGLPEGTLAGIAIGPGGRAYIVDMPTSRVLRVDPRSARN